MNKKNPSEIVDFRGILVRVTGFEPAASRSQTARSTIWATPGYSISDIIPWKKGKLKFFLFVVKHVVKAAFVPLSAIKGKPANADAARLCGVSSCPASDSATALPNQARYRLRYTRIFNFWHYITEKEKIKDFSACGHLCGESRFYAAFGKLDELKKCGKYRNLLDFLRISGGKVLK